MNSDTGKESNTSSHFSKGYMYTLEVLVIISLIVLSISFLFGNPPKKPDLEISTMKTQGFEALEYLDRTGDLRSIVASGNENRLEGRLNKYISKNLRYEAEICATNCTSDVATNETVVTVKYYVSGSDDTYLGKKVILWMWRKT